MPEPRSPRVGIDVGGTAVKLGVLDAGGRILGEDDVETGDTPASDVLDRVARATRAIVGERAIQAVGAGMPGLIDRARGRVLESPNLRAFDGCALRDELARRLGVAPEKVAVENDANAAALGEARLGAGRGIANLMMITLGTGVGGGLVLGGELVIGDGLAGEIGHVTIVPDGLRCPCGSRGCVEMYASATAAMRRARERGLDDDLIALADRARAADGQERELLVEVGRDLGHGLATALCLIDVRTFVLGGGFAGALDVMEPGIRRGVEEWAFGDRVSAVRLLAAELGPSAGWIGAAHLPVPLSDPHR